MTEVEKVDIAIVGAGIAGLSAAHAAVARGRSVALLEASDRPGGKMGSSRIEGFLVEHGPHSFLSGAARLWELIDRAGLGARVLKARPPVHRYVYRGGRLRRLPGGPLSLLGGDWMSYRGRARAACEPMIRSRSTPEESVDAFFRRRLGDELADGLIGPFVSGVYAGDARRLGAADAFPKLWKMEQEHGSLLKAMLRGVRPGNRSTAPGRGMYGFEAGMGGLAEAIAGALPEGTLRRRTRVGGLEAPGGGYRLELEGPEAAVNGRPETATLEAAKVLLALPAGPSASLLAPHSPEAARLLERSVLAPVALVHLGGPDPHRAAPEGFGALIARGEGVDALGILFPSALFAGRAPEGSWLHSVFVGGAHAPEVVQEDDEALIARALRSHRQVISPVAGRDLEISMSRVIRWSGAIPQYLPGHRGRIARAREAIAAELPGVLLAGACYDGISVADAAASGAAAAAALLG